MKMSNLKIRISIICLFLSFFVFSCNKTNESKEDLDLSLATAGVVVPQKLKDSTTLVACYYREKTVTFRKEIGKDSLARLDINVSKESTLNNLLNDTSSRGFVEKILAADASIRYIYVCDKDSVLFVISPQELKR